ncbi:MAG: rhomboid family intramembrane serine protease [Planctomycetota bacterium]
MGIYDRDYERSYDTGSGWRDGGGGGVGLRGGFGSWSANSKLIVVMIGVYLAQVFIGERFTDLFSLPADWFSQPWRVYGLVSYSMLHSTGGLYHLLFNGIALYFFGRVIDSRLGGREYLCFFFVAAAFAGFVWGGAEVATAIVTLMADDVPFGRALAAVVSGDAIGSTLIGASGGIAAIIVLFALWYPNVQVYLMGILPVPAWLMAILFIGQDISGALSRSGNVAYTAHLGGALFGFLYYKFGWRVSDWLPDFLGGNSDKGLRDLFKRKPKLRVHREDDDTASPAEDRVDEILRKIQSQGQDSLTSEERRTLERASRRYQKRRH